MYSITSIYLTNEVHVSTRKHILKSIFPGNFPGKYMIFMFSREISWENEKCGPRLYLNIYDIYDILKIVNRNPTQ